MAGASPSFGEVHLVRTLLVLSQGKVGRKNLVKILGLGEGSVRTIIKKLSKAGSINSKPRGHELTAKGKKVVDDYLKKFTMPQLADLDIAPGKESCVVVLHKAAGKITTGLNEREIAVKSGADGAVLVKKISKGLVFPCSDIQLNDYPETKEFLDEMDLSEDDVVVIGFSDSFEKAVEGALSIALDVTGI
ncbi:MAG: DUF4443 domain-containing protein [Candidatus Altiarchaeota archaeon]